MMADTKSTRILRLLSVSRNGMTSRQLFLELEDIADDSQALHVQVCQMVRRGYIVPDGKTECICCGHSSVTYRITEHGRIHLQYPHIRREKEFVCNS